MRSSCKYQVSAILGWRRKFFKIKIELSIVLRLICICIRQMSITHAEARAYVNLRSSNAKWHIAWDLNQFKLVNQIEFGIFSRRTGRQLAVKQNNSKQISLTEIMFCERKSLFFLLYFARRREGEKKQSERFAWPKPENHQTSGFVIAHCYKTMFIEFSMCSAWLFVSQTPKASVVDHLFAKYDIIFTRFCVQFSRQLASTNTFWRAETKPFLLLFCVREVIEHRPSFNKTLFHYNYDALLQCVINKADWRTTLWNRNKIIIEKKTKTKRNEVRALNSYLHRCF